LDRAAVERYAQDKLRLEFSKCGNGEVKSILFSAYLPYPDASTILALYSVIIFEILREDLKPPGLFPIRDGAIFTSTFRDHDIMYDGMVNSFSRVIGPLRKEEQTHRLFCGFKGN